MKLYRNDSVDEVDTTDLENWAVVKRREPVSEEDSESDSDEESLET